MFHYKLSKDRYRQTGRIKQQQPRDSVFRDSITRDSNPRDSNKRDS